MSKQVDLISFKLILSTQRIMIKYFKAKVYLQMIIVHMV
jgi:hypothetical protein